MQADAGGAQSRSYGGAAQVPADGAVARELASTFYSDENREPFVAGNILVKAARDLGPERPKGGNYKIEKRTRRPAEKHAKFDHASMYVRRHV